MTKMPHAKSLVIVHVNNTLRIIAQTKAKLPQITFDGIVCMYLA